MAVSHGGLPFLIQALLLFLRYASISFQSSSSNLPSLPSNPPQALADGLYSLGPSETSHRRERPYQTRCSNIQHAPASTGLEVANIATVCANAEDLERKRMPWVIYVRQKSAENVERGRLTHLFPVRSVVRFAVRACEKRERSKRERLCAQY